VPSRWLLPSVVVVALALAACDGSSASESVRPPACGVIDSRYYPPGSTVERLHREARLRVGVKLDSPGVSYRDPTSGQMTGFDVEIARIVACRLGVPNDRIEWVPAPNKSREKLIRIGAVDIVVASYVINDERRQLVSFAGPYYRDYQAVMVPTEETRISGPATIKGRTVCAATGSVSLQNIELYGGVGVPRTNYSDCIQLLLNRKVDAVTGPAAILIGQLTQHPAEVKIVGGPLDDFPYGIGLAKTDATFRRFLDDVLERSFSDGTWRRAYDMTLGRSGIGAPIPPVVRPY
jgi:glutamate transport system substrate-binding protein